MSEISTDERKTKDTAPKPWLVVKEDCLLKQYGRLHKTWIIACDACMEREELTKRRMGAPTRWRSCQTKKLRGNVHVEKTTYYLAVCKELSSKQMQRVEVVEDNESKFVFNLV